jgi:hypothetical protein
VLVLVLVVLVVLVLVLVQHWRNQLVVHTHYPATAVSDLPTITRQIMSSPSTTYVQQLRAQAHRAKNCVDEWEEEKARLVDAVDVPYFHLGHLAVVCYNCLVTRDHCLLYAIYGHFSSQRVCSSRLLG